MEVAASAWRETSTRGTPTRSSGADSESMPCASPAEVSPTAGRQQATVGEAIQEPSSHTSTTTARLPASPASHCSLWARIVAPGATAVNVEHRSNAGSSSSNAFTVQSSSGDTSAPAAIPSRSAVSSGSAAAAARYGSDEARQLGRADVATREPVAVEGEAARDLVAELPPDRRGRARRRIPRLERCAARGDPTSH